MIPNIKTEGINWEPNKNSNNDLPNFEENSSKEVNSMTIV